MKLINLNCITNSCNWNTYVSWRGNEYELCEDDTIVSKHVGSVIIYKLFVIVLLLVILQKKNYIRFIRIKYLTLIKLIIVSNSNYFHKNFTSTSSFAKCSSLSWCNFTHCPKIDTSFKTSIMLLVQWQTARYSDSASLKNTTMYWYLAAFVALPVYCRLTENNFYLISQRQWNTSTRASIMLRYSCSNCDIADGKWVTTRDIHTHTSLCASLRYVFTSLVLPHKMQHPKFSLGTGQTCGVYWHLLY